MLREVIKNKINSLVWNFKPNSFKAIGELEFVQISTTA